MDTTIYIAAHKEFETITDACYQPIMCGTAGKENDFGYQRDDEGDNISADNPRFCEITGLYWMWKHSNADIVGLAHYRRYLSDGKKHPLDKERIEELLSKHDVILPKKRHYYIETVKTHYCHSHHEKDMDTAQQVVGELFPEYSEAMTTVLGRRSAYICNMFIMRREMFCAYCQWLFPILFELDRRIDITGYDAFNKRVIGFLAERLFNVWLEKNKPDAVEVPVYCTEKQNKLKKYTDFVIRKIKGRR